DEQWEKSHQIRDENEYREGHHDREKLQAMGSDDLFQQVTDRKDSQFQSLLSRSGFVFRKLSFQNPNHYQTENAGNHKHHGVPRDRILRCVRAESGFRRRTKLTQKLLPERIGVLHFEVISRLAKILIDKLHQDRRLLHLLGRFLSLL